MCLAWELLGISGLVIREAAMSRCNHSFTFGCGIVLMHPGAILPKKKKGEKKTEKTKSTERRIAAKHVVPCPPARVLWLLIYKRVVTMPSYRKPDVTETMTTSLRQSADHDTLGRW